MARLPVILDHDGGVDDYLATALLMPMTHVDPRGVIVTPADCYPAAAVGATRKPGAASGRKVTVLSGVDVDEFYRYVLSQWANHPATALA